ncbi:uncharacterized protein BXZ73DRAFT_38178, partial [Epithele typhae]|uniref:uncharacterized protein n=1 Tax=Epithele typhae TaxID=378194 RepID=UPI002007F00F
MRDLRERESPPSPPPPSAFAVHNHSHTVVRNLPAPSPSVEADGSPRPSTPGDERGTVREGPHVGAIAYSSSPSPHIPRRSPGSSVERIPPPRLPASPQPSTSPSPLRAHTYPPTSVESTPLPLPATPSTTFEYPLRAATLSPPPKTDSITGAAHKGSHTMRTAASRRHYEQNAKSDKEALKEAPSTFDERALPTREQVQQAAALTVIAQNGVRIQFGDLFKDQKTIVIFIRHFWCANDQDYMYSIARTVNLNDLKGMNMNCIIIGNGSHGMIRAYRNIFRTPVQVYTDPSLRLYAALGMTLRTNDPGTDHEKGDYVRHGAVSGLAMIVKNAIRVRMPIWECGGNSAQLGGEIVLGPGYECTHAHRMMTTRSHAPIRDVL